VAAVSALISTGAQIVFIWLALIAILVNDLLFFVGVFGVDGVSSVKSQV